MHFSPIDLIFRGPEPENQPFWPEIARNQGMSRNLAITLLEKHEILLRFISEGERRVG